MFPLKQENLNMNFSLAAEAIKFVRESIDSLMNWRYSEYKRRRRRANFYTNLWKF